MMGFSPPPVTPLLPRTTARFIGVAQTSLASISEGGTVLVSSTLPRPAPSGYGLEVHLVVFVPDLKL